MIAGSGVIDSCELPYRCCELEPVLLTLSYLWILICNLPALTSQLLWIKGLTHQGCLRLEICKVLVLVKCIVVPSISVRVYRFIVPLNVLILCLFFKIDIDISKLP